MSLRPIRSLSLGFCALAALAFSASATTYVVTNNLDSGPGSLRDALASAGVSDVVTFAITTPSKSIRPLTGLGIVTMVDGTTQPGYSGKPVVEIDCSLMPALTSCVGVNNGGTLKAIAVNRSPWYAVGLSAGGRVIGCFIGTDVTGETALGNDIGVQMGANAILGGPGAGDGNLISGNYIGVVSSSFAFSGTPQILGNRIGTNAEGTAAIPNIDYGIDAQNGPVTVGVPGHGNLISGNGVGIELFYSDDSVIQGNQIGTDASGTGAIAGQGLGIKVYQSSRALIGGPGAAANTIVCNGSAAISIQPTSNRNRVSRNSISGTALGIDLDYAVNPAVTENDACDADSGPNLLLNYPVITAATVSGGAVVVQGTLESEPSASYDLEFFSSPTAGFMGHGPAVTYLGTISVSTDAGCAGSFQASFPLDVPAGSVVSATSTDSIGDTSELSFSATVATSAVSVTSISPTSGPSGGGTIVIAGAGFQAGATVTVGGKPATGVSVDSSSQITATVPILPASLLETIVVTNPDSSVGALVNAWLVDFFDVPSGSPFHPFTEALVRAGVAAGCGGGDFCPGDAATRAQMAVFLLRAKNGSAYTPPAASGTVFSDVPATAFAAAYIEALAAASVTAGCGNGNYCPNDPINRAQMAVFLLRTSDGPSYVPPACVTPTFADLPCSSPFARWVDELASRGVTAGCGGGNYCPDAPVTRGQMAVFLTVMFLI